MFAGNLNLFDCEFLQGEKAESGIKEKVQHVKVSSDLPESSDLLGLCGQLTSGKPVNYFNGCTRQSPCLAVGEQVEGVL